MEFFTIPRFSCVHPFFDHLRSLGYVPSDTEAYGSGRQRTPSEREVDIFLPPWSFRGLSLPPYFFQVFH